MQKIYIGADHRGFALKEQLKTILGEDFEIVDLGPDSYNENDDFPDISFKVAETVAKEDKSKGILICGSSFGVCVAANKVKGIVATNPDNVNEAREDKQHHDGNLICLTADELDINEATEIFETWINTKPLEGKYVRRMEKIREYENKM